MVALTVNPSSREDRFPLFPTTSDVKNFDSSLFKNRMGNISFSNPKLAIPKTFSYQSENSFSSQKALFKNVVPATVKKGSSLLGEMVLEGFEVDQGISSNIKTGISIGHSYFNLEKDPALDALGITSALKVILGPVAIHHGIQNAKEADKISDAWGRSLAHLKIMRGGTKTFSGALAIPTVAVALSGAATASKVVTTVMGVLGRLGGYISGFGSFLLMIVDSMKIHEQKGFRDELNKILKDTKLPLEERHQKALTHLKGLLEVSSAERELIRTKIRKKEPSLSGLEVDFAAYREEEKLLKAKEARVKRCVGSDAVTLMREAKPAEAAKVIETLLDKNKEKMIIASIGIALSALSVIAAVAVSVFAGPAIAIASLALALTTGLGYLALDAYHLFNEFKAGTPGRFDKLWLYLSTFVALITVVTVSFLSAGIAPIVIASVIGSVWLATSIACYLRLRRLKELKIK